MKENTIENEKLETKIETGSDFQRVTIEKIDVEKKGYEVVQTNTIFTQTTVKIEQNQSPFLIKKPATEPPSISTGENKIIQEEFEKSNLKDSVEFKRPCKLYRKDEDTQKFVARGEGTLYVSIEPTTQKFRIFLVRNQIKTFGCNHFINPKINCYPMKNQKTSFMWYALGDTCDTGKTDEAKQIFAAKFETESDALLFKKSYDLGMLKNSK